MSDFSKTLQNVMNHRANPFDVYLIEANTSSGLSEKVRLHTVHRCIQNRNYNLLPEAMTELAGVRHITNIDRDSQEAMRTAVKLFRTNGHLQESWKAMGQMIEIARSVYNLDLTEELSRYKPDEIALLEVTMEPVDPNAGVSNTIAHEIEYTSKTKYKRARKDGGLAVKNEYPVEQEVDIWKGETHPHEVYTESNTLSKLQKARMVIEKVQGKVSLQEAHSDKVASFFSNLKFDDPRDVEYQAEDIVKGMKEGIRKNRNITFKDDLLGHIAELLD